MPVWWSSGFTSVDQVVEVIAAIISICSQRHAAANFGQYDQYGFVPNYPAILYGSVPTSKRTEPNERELLNYLPGRFTTRMTMIITELLSYHGTNKLGDFEVQYLYHKVGTAAAKKFRKELKELQEKIDQRNAAAEFPYKWQSPSVVPNAISV